MKIYLKVLLISSLIVCPLALSAQLDVQKELLYCASQALKTIEQIPAGNTNIPRSIAPGQRNWRYVDYHVWCSGFWPGLLWYAWEATGDQHLLREAEKFTAQLRPLSEQQAFDHDLGFQVFRRIRNSFR